jgi:hypothetical protein
MIVELVTTEAKLITGEELAMMGDIRLSGRCARFGGRGPIAERFLD